MDPTTTIRATCACRTFDLEINFPTSSLPLPRAFCLCNSCRSFSGTCGNSYITIPTSQSISPSKFNLTAYATSSDSTRYFCSTCGAHVLTHLVIDDVWTAATGVWDRTEGIVEWTGCKWVDDTLDGGVSVWLNDIVNQSGEKKKLQRWKLRDGDGHVVNADALKKFTPTKESHGGEDILKAACHCRGVKFYITRPNEASRAVHSPFPDLITPFHSASSANPDNEAWWIRHDTRYMAGTCTCTTCRAASGFEIQTWAFVPRCNIFQEDGKEMSYEMGTLRRYESSEDVWREFCAVCGATVFWHNKERPGLVDVSIGLLDPEEGARAERWLDWWTDRVSFEEMAVSKSLIRSLSNGLREWGNEKDPV